MLKFFAEEDKLVNAPEVAFLNVYVTQRNTIRDAVNKAKLAEVTGGDKKDFAISSSSLGQVHEITTCGAKNEDDSVGAEIECPAHVLQKGFRSTATLKVSYSAICGPRESSQNALREDDIVSISVKEFFRGWADLFAVCRTYLSSA